MGDKIVFFGTIYLVSLYFAYSAGFAQATKSCSQKKVQVEYVNPKVKCTYPKVVTSITPYQQWNRIASK